MASRATRFSAAISKIEDAISEIEELKDELQSLVRQSSRESSKQ